MEILFLSSSSLLPIPLLQPHPTSSSHSSCFSFEVQGALSLPVTPTMSKNIFYFASCTQSPYPFSTDRGFQHRSQSALFLVLPPDPSHAPPLSLPCVHPETKWEQVKVTVSKPIKGALEANLYFRCNRVIITALVFLEGPSLPLPLASFLSKRPLLWAEATWVEQGVVMTGSKPSAP